MGWFDSKPDPKEQVREWRSKLRHEMNGLDRQVSKIEREEMKIKISLKQAAKQGHMDSAKVLAKSLVQSKKAKNRILMSKAQINSVMMEMQNQLSMAKVTNALSASTRVMEAMSSLIKMEEIRDTMMALSKEMMKAGLIEEMVSDSMDSALEEEGLDEAADVEVDKILFEVTKGQMGAAPDAVKDELVGPEETEVSDEAVDALMRERLEALRT